MGAHIKGAEKLRAAWTEDFKMFPDYSISHSEILANGDTVAVFGEAQGMLANGRFCRVLDWRTGAE
jgi:hypothetical protein